MKTISDKVCQCSEGNAELNILIRAAFQTMLDSTNDMVFVKNKDLVYMAASMPFVKMVGKEKVEEIIDHTDIEIFEDGNLAERYVADDRKLMDDGVNLVDYVEPITEENGQPRYGSTSKYLLYNEEGGIIGILGITKDITKDYIARQQYQQEIKYMFELPKNAYAVTYIDIDNWRIISQRRQLILEGTYQACHTVEGLCEAALDSIVDESSDVAAFYRNFSPDNLKKIYESGRTSISFKYQRYLSDNSIRWVRNDVRLIMDVESGNLCAILSAKDIDAQKQKEQKLLLAARMDKMTMLLNRETTMEEIRSILKKEGDSKHALFMTDVDNFKILNDTLGHRAGDKFLIDLADEIKKCFGVFDVVGRIGGDEFFALMKNVPDTETVEQKAQDLLNAIQRVCSSYLDIPLSGSIGISLYPENAATLEELYEKADSALYEAKRNGKNRFVFSKNKVENNIF